MDRSSPLSPLALQLIAQIRIDIAAAWEHIEAGRAILARSAWLLERWREQTLAGEPSLVPQAGRVSVAGDFIFVEPKPAQPRRHAGAHRKAA